MPRFPRYISDDFLRRLAPGGSLDFLITGCSEPAAPDPYAVDVQLRVGNTLQYYHGSTSLLRIAFDGERLHADAARTYRNLIGFEELFAACPIESAAAQTYRRLLSSYLAAAVSAADPRHYADRTAGYWQNRLSIYCGRDWRPGTELLAIDREVCVEFESTEARQELLGPHRAKRVRQFQAEPQSVPGPPVTLDSLGYASDFLALAPDGTLVSGELVEGTNTRGMRLGPMRALACRDDFQLLLVHIAGDVERLVRQKTLLGLLPPEAVNRLPPTGLRRVECAVVVVAKDGERASWERLGDTMTLQGETKMSIFQLWSDDRTGLGIQRLREISC